MTAARWGRGRASSATCSAANRRLYHAGDTIVTDALRAALAPRIDVALLPINGRDAERESRGIVGNMDAAEAVELALEIGASTLVPYHWDGFAGNTVPPGATVDAAAGRIHVVVPSRFGRSSFPAARSVSAAWRRAARGG